MASTEMQKTTSKSGLLQKLQDSPQLPALIENLQPTVLHKLIQQIGLKDSGDIIAHATTNQLKEILEVELWQNQKPGPLKRDDLKRGECAITPSNGNFLAAGEIQFTVSLWKVRR